MNLLPLEGVERPALDGIAHRWLLLLLHEVGSNEHDLFTLAPRMPDCFHVVSLRAPFAMAPGAWGWFGFTLCPDGSRTIDAAQEQHSRAQLGAFVAARAAQLDIDAESVVVGGFGQGGIMALSLLLTRPDLVRAAMVMHSRLLPEVLSHIAPAARLRRRQLWLSYGTDDALIPLKYAHEVQVAMKKLRLVSTYAEFPGGHELSTAEIRQALEWLTGLAAIG